MSHVSGLRRLYQLDHLFVKPRLCKRSDEIAELETTNTYDIFDSSDKLVFAVKEESNPDTRLTIGSQRDVNIKILDGDTDQPLLCMKRPLESLYNSQEVTIFRDHTDDQTMGGQPVGSVMQEFSLLRQPAFNVKDSEGVTQLQIERVVLGSVGFQILDLDDRQVGKISKRSVGLSPETFNEDVNNFAISFPQDLDLNLKAVLLCTCLLIDFLFY